MKSKTYIQNRISVYLVVLILSISFSCSNEFLKQESKIADPVSDTIRMTSLESRKVVTFNVPNAGNAKWTIFQFPAWLDVSPLSGQFKDGISSFQLNVENINLIGNLGLLNLSLVFDVEGIGLVEYPFQYLNFGNPEAFFSTDVLNIDYRETDAFYLRNLGQGILVWNVDSKPAWLTLSREYGVLGQGEEELFTAMVSRQNLSKGNYSGDIFISTNTGQATKRISVRMQVLDLTFGGKVLPIEGEVVDAAYCKNTGLLVYATRNPNRINFINNDNSAAKIDLLKIPVNVAISENGDQIGATFTNTDLSVISPIDFSIKKTLSCGIMASDLEFGNNDWAYISPKEYDTDYLKSINLTTGEVVKDKEYLNGLTLLKKVPGKNLLYGTKVGWSPDFLFVFDISNGAVKEPMDQYAMELNKFWFSEDGNRMFTGWRKIYLSPVYQQKGYIFENLPTIGELEQFSGAISAIDHSISKKEIYVAYKSYTENASKVLRIDDSGYFTKETKTVNNIVVIENNVLLNLPPEIPYMFVNKAGSKLHLFKKASNYNNHTYWYLEKMDLN